MRKFWKILPLVLWPLCNAHRERAFPLKPPFLSSEELSEVKGSYKTPGGSFSYVYTLPVPTIPPPPIPGCDTKAPPTCVNGTEASFCNYDPDYPKYEIKAIKHAWKLSPFALKEETDNITSRGLVEDLSRTREEFIFYSLYTGVSSGPTPYDPTHWSGPEGFLCPSSISYATLRRAKNIEGDWRVIVQDSRSLTTQTTRLETCLYPESSCRALPPCYRSRCLQKYVYHRLVSYNPCDPFKGFVLDIFKLPSACSCQVDKGFLPKHKDMNKKKNIGINAPAPDSSGNDVDTPTEEEDIEPEVPVEDSSRNKLILTIYKGIEPAVSTTDSSGNEDASAADSSGNEDASVADSSGNEDGSAADSSGNEDASVADSSKNEDGSAADSSGNEEIPTTDNEIENYVPATHAIRNDIDIPITVKDIESDDFIADSSENEVNIQTTYEDTEQEDITNTEGPLT